MKSYLIIGAFILLVALAITGCGSPNDSTTNVDADFLNGLWDGMTAVFAFIGNLFGGRYGVYEVHNSGGWYDFGFLLGIGALGASVSETTR